MRPHIDPTQYAKQRQEQIARAQRLRDERKGRPVPENSGDSLDELAGPIRSEMPHAQPHAQNGSAQMSSPGLDSLDRATDGTSSSWRAERQRGAGADTDGARAPAQAERSALPPGWTEHRDRTSGKAYYHHAASKTTTWERPAPPAAAPSPRVPSKDVMQRDYNSWPSARRADDPPEGVAFARRGARDSNGRADGVASDDFDHMCDVLEGRGAGGQLSASQAARIAALLAKEHPDALQQVALGPIGQSLGLGARVPSDSLSSDHSARDRELLTRSDSLSTLKSSLRSRSRGGDATATAVLNELDGGASDDADGADGGGPPRAARRRRPAPSSRRPEWNSDFADAGGADSWAETAEQREPVEKTSTLRTQSADEHGNLGPGGARAHRRRGGAARSEWNSDFTDTGGWEAGGSQPERDEGVPASAPANFKSKAERSKPAAQAPAAADALPPGWTEHRDRKSGKAYYHHAASKTTTWERPTPPVAAPPLDAAPSEARAGYRGMWRPDDAEHDADNGGSAPRRRREPPARQPAAASDAPAASANGSFVDAPISGSIPDGANFDGEDKGTCTVCSREMTVTALARMEKLHGIRCCPKCAPKKERKKFNVAAQRAEAFDGDDKRLVKQGIVAVKKERAQKQKAADAPQRAPTSLAEEATGKGVPKWKAQSSALRDAMKQMREIKKAEESGVPLSALPPAPAAAPDPSLVQCPNCGRRFNESAAERHIPKCATIKAKPTTLRRGQGTQLGAASRTKEAGSTGGKMR